MENKKKSRVGSSSIKEVDKVDDLAEHYWNTIHYFVGLIKSSEIKAGLILSFYGLILNFVYQNAESTMELLSGQVFLYILLGLWFCCTLVSIYFSIRSFIPRIENKYDSNVFFFGDIINKYGSINEFSKTFYAISEDRDQRYDQLGQQIYINAKIAARKFKNVNMSLRFLALGLVLLLLIISNYLLAVLV
ncbi:MAG: hypothetical protein ACI83B_001065 [Sediminicola sp.]|jgi:hypothetical protein